MPAGVRGWEYGMNWGKKERLEEKIFMISWEWGKKGNSRSSAAELWIRQDGIRNGRSKVEVKICRQPIYFPGRRLSVSLLI